ncbi:GNAT family N-acetyltransferase [Bacillus sp. FJAT-49736]|uniref:GNAT family N-acetyltransferase n=1 Tax=Bacillus sp. FJAT-49736 TaxID=2833582 RepID=UPI001BC8FA43|nr:GNAT family N-acetyltransferase [Bacillus sp. FJAT-49736]MBS4175557.1 GNAT family N-acetyltransferase [Bacillus sp. FJAT-49736]
MEYILKSGEVIKFRLYKDEDFVQVHQLNIQEEWNNLVEKKEDARQAWVNSNVKFVAILNEKIIGYIRGITDENITLFVCELLIGSDYRGLGIGTSLLKFAHQKFPKTRMELLGSNTSYTYYENLKFRNFQGFRKTLVEW